MFTSAQDVTPPALSPEIAELRAVVFALQSKLVEVERELGEEKARRAKLEQEKLIDAAQKLDPAVKVKLGIPVQSEAPTTQAKPESKTKPVAEPPKS
jgi:hypothetical protein